jgi:hypothetical protein
MFLSLLRYCDWKDQEFILLRLSFIILIDLFLNFKKGFGTVISISFSWKMKASYFAGVSCVFKSLEVLWLESNLEYCLLPASHRDEWKISD